MVLGILGVISIPTSLGIWEGVKASQGQPDPEEDARRSKECYLNVFCNSDHPEQAQVHGKYIVLRDNKAWISDFAAPDVFPFTGFYIDYPSEDRHRGMVTMTSMTPPAMGWLYVDKDTLEAKYGNKTASIEHIKGPWDWTEDESGVLLEDKEAFVAVQEKPGEWALYFDRREDRSALPKGKLALPISLDRELKDDEPKAVG